ncbi:phospholipase A2 homolog otoconin-22-like [Ornithorhynchus anatinus]|uniref:phospholipase A2 homolog otoconin-22-like n=1 Tax=Ornithorhynchus anatinus TaxID=9258 RepID=UPI0010A88652|nr:phospholipase A2 homolog otoconin-22-like [Ornithorhynchus anatinus]
MGLALLRLLTFAWALTLGGATDAQFDELIGPRTVTHGLANFTGYGCHCGPGTRGPVLDKIDKCCRGHDCRYDKAEMFGCAPGTHTYRYYSLPGKIKCVKTRYRCEKMACECDQKAAKCFGKHPFVYDPQRLRFPSLVCSGPLPFC